MGACPQTSPPNYLDKRKTVDKEFLKEVVNSMLLSHTCTL